MSKPQTNLREFFADVAFADRFEREPDVAVDVIIPMLHTNELWRANLLSIYREIPVKRLLLGDGGCTENTIEIARSFPRVEVFDHSRLPGLNVAREPLTTLKACAVKVTRQRASPAAARADRRAAGFARSICRRAHPSTAPRRGRGRWCGRAPRDPT